MKDRRSFDAGSRQDLRIWQSIDSWVDQKPTWEKKKPPTRNVWEVRSYPGSEEEITGKPVFPRKKYLNKTPRRWLELLLFFLLFYTVLFGATVGLFHFYAYVVRGELDKPPYCDIINRTVGITVLPRLNEINAGLNNGLQMEYILFDPSSNTDVDKFLQSYSKKAETGVSCSYDSPRPNDKSCNFDINDVGPCSSSSEICFFVKVTRTLEKVLKTYKKPDELPSNFPKDLKSVFESLPEKERNRIWLHCWKVKNDKLEDKPFTLTPFPSHSSFPAYFFPFNGRKDYQDPLVAFQVKADSGTKTVVHCKVWEKSVSPIDFEQGSLEFIFNLK